MKDEGWYGVRLVFESLHPEEPGLDRFFEEQIVLVRAAGEDSAKAKATDNAISRQHMYLNAYEKRVEVVFAEVLDVFELFDDTPRDFSEVYSHFLNQRELESVRDSLEPGSADRAWPDHAESSTPKPPSKRRTKSAKPARTK